MCVDARGLRVSRSDETRRCNMVRVGPAWLQWHGWWFGRNGKLEAAGHTKVKEGNKRTAIRQARVPPQPRPAGGMIYMYTTRDKAGTKRLQGTYEYGQILLCTGTTNPATGGPEHE